MRKLLPLIALLVAAPAAAGEPDRTYDSAKAPAEISACMVAAFGKPRVRPLSPDGVQVARTNNFGMAIVRWDIRPTATGSRIEYRDKFGVMSGRDKAAACF